MRQALAVLALLLCSITSSLAQFSVNIGVNLPVYPQLVRVPGYPVYYAPQINSNYFFYDGMYWVYANDNWYASTWYNGPWELVAPDFVPVFLLRVPVRYYRRPPVYFHGWRSDAAPRWGDHWGNTWYSNHRDWDSWNRSAAPAPAPLPVYQRQYSGNRYPRPEQQVTLQTRNYTYQPRDATVQRQYQAQRAQMPAAAAADRPRSTPSSATQQVARPPGSAQSRPPQMEHRDAQQAARPPSPQQARAPQTAQQAARPPSPQQARPPQTAQQAARPPSSPQARPPQNEQRAAQQEQHATQQARPPNSQGRPPGAEQRAAAPLPQTASAQPPRPPQAAAPHAEAAPHAQNGEPPPRGQGESHGNGRGPQDNKPD